MSLLATFSQLSFSLVGPTRLHLESEPPSLREGRTIGVWWVGEGDTMNYGETRWARQVENGARFQKERQRHCLPLTQSPRTNIFVSVLSQRFCRARWGPNGPKSEKERHFQKAKWSANSWWVGRVGKTESTRTEQELWQTLWSKWNENELR